MKGKNTKRIDAHEVITNKIIEKLEKGIVPWQRPWNSVSDAPRNFVSKNLYTGINAFHLATEGYMSPYWLTFKQAQELGGNVKKGEAGSKIVYASTFKTKEEEIDRKTGKKEEVEVSRHFLKLYTVFNSEQVEGVEFPQIEPANLTEFQTIENAQKIIDQMPSTMPKIEHYGNKAAYTPSLDVLKMPQKSQFDNEPVYYSVLFHELTHATGHETRLGRHGVIKTHAFRSKTHSKEELIAEMGAAFLCGEAGILNKTIDVSSAYIQEWLKVLRADKRMVVQAASKATQSTKYILKTG